MEPFLVRLLIGCAVEWLFSQVISNFVTEQKAQRMLQLILLVVVVIFVLFGGYFFGGGTLQLK